MTTVVWTENQFSNEDKLIFRFWTEYPYLSSERQLLGFLERIWLRDFEKIYFSWGALIGYTVKQIYCGLYFLKIFKKAPE